MGPLADQERPRPTDSFIGRVKGGAVIVFAEPVGDIAVPDRASGRDGLNLRVYGPQSVENSWVVGGPEPEPDECEGVDAHHLLGRHVLTARLDPVPQACVRLARDGGFDR